MISETDLIKSRKLFEIGSMRIPIKMNMWLDVSYWGSMLIGIYPSKDALVQAMDAAVNLPHNKHRLYLGWKHYGSGGVLRPSDAINSDDYKLVGEPTTIHIAEVKVCAPDDMIVTVEHMNNFRTNEMIEILFKEGLEYCPLETLPIHYINTLTKPKLHWIDSAIYGFFPEVSEKNKPCKKNQFVFRSDTKNRPFHESHRWEVTLYASSEFSDTTDPTSMNKYWFQYSESLLHKLILA